MPYSIGQISLLNCSVLTASGQYQQAFHFGHGVQDDKPFMSPSHNIRYRIPVSHKISSKLKTELLCARLLVINYCKMSKLFIH